MNVHPVGVRLKNPEESVLHQKANESSLENKLSELYSISGGEKDLGKVFTDRKVRVSSQVRNYAVNQEVASELKRIIRSLGCNLIEGNETKITFDVPPRLLKPESPFEQCLENGICLSFYTGRTVEALFHNESVLNMIPPSVFPCLEKKGSRFTLSWKESDLLNRHVVNGFVVENMPKCSVELAKPDIQHDKMMFVKMSEVAVAKCEDIKFIATVGMTVCQSIIMYDKLKKVASFGHYIMDEISPKAIETQAGFLLDKGCLKGHIEAKVFGGYTARMGCEAGYFDTISKTLSKLDIPVSETFLGNHSPRPINIIFDIESGTVFSMKYSPSLRRKWLRLISRTPAEIHQLTWCCVPTPDKAILPCNKIYLPVIVDVCESAEGHITTCPVHQNKSAKIEG